MQKHHDENSYDPALSTNPWQINLNPALSPISPEYEIKELAILDRLLPRISIADKSGVMEH